MMSLMTSADTQVWIRVLTVSNSTCESAKLCQIDVIGSIYKIDITIYGVPTRALIDSGSQVCIVRQQLLPIVKDKCNWSLSDCLVHNLPLNNKPVGAEGSVLGVTALVNLEVTVEVTGKSLKVPCYVIDSTKPAWKGDAKNCGMIMGSNALVAFQFHILHANGIEILPVNSANLLAVGSAKQLEPIPANSVKQASEVMSKHTCALVGSSKPTVLFECYKPTQLSQHLAELAVLPMQKVVEQTMLPKIPNVPSTRVLVVVLKCTTQVMPGITKWINVQVQEQSSVTDLVEPDDAFYSTNVEEVSNKLLTPDQCTKQSVPHHLHTSSGLTSLQDTVYSNCLPVIAPTEDMVINEQCTFVNGICNCEELSKVPLVNWGTQPQVFKKGTVIGYV